MGRPRRAWAQVASTTNPEKQNVPPFRGGTWEPFYAGGHNCQLQRAEMTVPRETPVSLKKRNAMLR
jgi:hypothetical protein